jgi:hypothetical protein
MEGEEVKILFDYGTGTGIKECKIVANNENEERQLLEARDKIIGIFGASTAVEVATASVDSVDDQSASEGTTDLFTTGGC